MGRAKKQVKVRKPRRGRALFFVLGALAASIVSYFFDPQQGRRRRAVMKDMTAARARRGKREIETARVRATNKAQGVAARMQPREPREFNDPTLQHKVESEVLRDFPAGRVNVNAHDGVVELRGVLDRPEDIEKLEERVRHVEGVRDVENLTHLSGSA